MSDASPAGDRSLRASALRRVDRACDQFEAAWKAGRRPRIENELGEAFGPERAALLRELVALEVDYRIRAGETPTPEEYRRRFPEDAEIIAAVFRDATKLSALTHGPDPETVDLPQDEALHICCPSCLDPIELVIGPMDDIRSEEVHCPSCGSDFPLEWGTAPAQVSRLRGGRCTLGNYELNDMVGVGGVGRVYRAYDPRLDRTVAIKIPRVGKFADKEERDRFVREARSVAQLRHPAIVPVYDVGEHEGLPYLVSQFVQGTTLSDLIASRRSNLEEAARLVAEVADALQYAHKQGVVHRDVKPSNIMIDEQGRPHLMDFGLAKREAGEITMTLDGQMLGTPAYMSPEQADGMAHLVDGRTDVYSLGVILYELLTGVLPFQGSSRMLLHQVLHDEPKPLRTLNDCIPRDLETICLKAMAKQPAWRYAGAGELAEDLRRFLRGEPILARPVGVCERVWRWAKRRPAAAALVGISGLAALALMGVAVSIMDNARLQEANRIAVTQQQNAIRAVRAEAKARKSAEEAGRKAEEARQVAAELSRRAETSDYFHRILLAEREWSINNVDRANQLLEECPDKLRHWEWRYLKRLCREKVLTIPGYASVNDVAFTADGKRVALSLSDTTVNVWDLANVRQVLTLQGGGEVLFSPDGRWIAADVSSHDGDVEKREIKIWDAATGREVMTLPSRPGGWVLGMAFSPDGKRIAIADYQIESRDIIQRSVTELGIQALWPGISAFLAVFRVVDVDIIGRAKIDLTTNELVLWDTATGQESLVLWRKKENVFARLNPMASQDIRTVTGVAFSPNGTRIAASEITYRNNLQYQELKIYDVDTGQEILSISGGAGSVAFSPDGRRIAAIGSSDEKDNPRGEVKIWDAETGRELRTLGDGGGVVAFSPDWERISSVRPDQTVKIYENSNEQEIVTLRGYSGNVRSLAFDSDGKHFTSVSGDGTIKVWNLTAGTASYTLLGHTAPVAGLAFSPDGQRIASAGGDRTVKVWDAATGQQVLDLSGHTDQVRNVVFSPDGRRLASASFDRTIRVWDAATGQQVLDLSGHTDAVWCVAFSPDGRRLASASADKTVKVWDGITGRVALTLRGHSDPVTSLAMSPDGLRLATVGDDHTVRVWDMLNGREILSFRDSTISIFTMVSVGHPGFVTSVGFSPDGRRLASSSGDQVVIWDLQAASAVRGQTDVVQEMVLNFRGMHLALATDNPTTKRLVPAIGQNALILRGHTGNVQSVIFSPDCRRLASAGEDQTIKLWDSATGREILTLYGHTGSVSGLVFSPDGQRLASAGGDQTIKLWDATPVDERSGWVVEEPSQ